ncbi:hypothetical protein OUZ56_032888 [Daphnia magna]|uniref:Uncharacterized protein n=1 Tax=Daphnia magna TaxID=35525 RepID=A0ABR0B9U0_9CRUS|nr:hypothetical protein OUZ56_032888 [Daphnia magna]
MTRKCERRQDGERSKHYKLIEIYKSWIQNLFIFGPRYMSIENFFQKNCPKDITEGILLQVTSKWRQKLVSKRRKLESKAANLIQDINEKSVMGEELVTTEHFNSGIFPWDFANKISFQDNFKLVDCWNLKKRNQECIVHTKKEMRNYLYSISNDLMERRNEIGVLTGASDLRSKGELSIKCIEYSRLIALLRNALSYYRFFGEETSGEFRGLAELVVESDDRDLDFFNEQSILECSENECDSDDEDDCVSG